MHFRICRLLNLERKSIKFFPYFDLKFEIRLTSSPQSVCQRAQKVKLLCGTRLSILFYVVSNRYHYQRLLYYVYISNYMSLSNAFHKRSKSLWVIKSSQSLRHSAAKQQQTRRIESWWEKLTQSIHLKRRPLSLS